MPDDPADKLDALFAMQAALNRFTLAANDQPDFDAIAADPALQEEWVQKYVLAIRQECAELFDSTNWKWWRTKVDLFDPQNIKVELIDILHFWISACQVMGLDADDVLRIYREKNKVNLQRQESGYVEKDPDDSRHIG
jgi:dimeric dUTPase (all-alpha-NTP-PPase superfamily)